jgi:Glycosyltransferase family 87
MGLSTPAVRAGASARALRLSARVLLSCVLAASSWRLLGYVVRFGQESLQADFSAFYTAGEAERAGLSPYSTYPDHNPPLWDGLATHHVSRFLYPPLFASFMSPLTRLPYIVAKQAWTVASLAAIAAALVVLGRALRRKPPIESILGLAAFVALFHPLLTHLDRGQVDAFTLLAVSGALAPLVTEGDDRFGSGIWLAFGTALKPNVAGLLPFILLRRRWRAAAGWALGGLAAALLTVALQGRPGFLSYLTRELPRIAVEGEEHGPGGQLEPEVLARLRAGASEGYTIREGHLYRIESMSFLANASIVRLLKRDLALRIGRGRLSLLFLAGLVVVMAVWQRRHPRIREEPGGLRELAYWQIVMAGLLLCWPFTWAMNVVWLLPTALVVIHATDRFHRLAQVTALVVCCIGLVLAGLPDTLAFALLVPWGEGGFKYVLAELLVGASLLTILADLPKPEPAGERKAGAGRGQGLEVDVRQIPRGADVPGVRKDEAARLVELAEGVATRRGV